MSTADQIAQAFPFPREADLTGKRPAELRAMGLTPPFHGKCRCDVNMLWRRVERRPSLLATGAREAALRREALARRAKAGAVRRVTTLAPKKPPAKPTVGAPKATNIPDAPFSVTHSTRVSAAQQKEFEGYLLQSYNQLPGHLRSEFGTGYKVGTYAVGDDITGLANSLMPGVSRRYNLKGITPGSADGLCFETENAIMIRAGDRAPMTIRHEMGHQVFENRGSQFRNSWNGLSQRTKLSSRISSNARRSDVEHFSDTFSAYQSKYGAPALKEKTPDIYNWLRDEVFDGHEYI